MKTNYANALSSSKVSKCPKTYCLFVNFNLKAFIFKRTPFSNEILKKFNRSFTEKHLETKKIDSDDSSMISESPNEQSDLEADVRHLAENTVIQEPQNVIDGDNNLIKITEKDNSEKAAFDYIPEKTESNNIDADKQFGETDKESTINKTI